MSTTTASLLGGFDAFDLDDVLASGEQWQAPAKLLGENAVEVDRLFREAHAACRHHDRGRSTQAFSRAMLEFRVGVAEERLQASRLRNAELARRARLLETALHNHRAQYAACLRHGLCGAPASRGDDSGDIARHHLSTQGDHSKEEIDVGLPPSSSRSADDGNANEPAPVGRAPSTPEQGANWRYFEAHLPRTRKRLMRAELCQALCAIGLEDVESIFEETPPSPAASRVRGHPSTMAATAETSLTSSPLRDFGERRADSKEAADFPFAPPSRLSDGNHISAKPTNVPDDRRLGANGRKLLRWGQKTTLRSHLDSVRCVALCAEGETLLSCSEDALVKAWDLSFLHADPSEPPSPGSEGTFSGLDEPFATFRGHWSAVLSVVEAPVEHLLYSGGLDGDIRSWYLPLSSEYDKYGASPIGQPSPLACRQRLRAHQDAVWAMCLDPDLGLLASASADKTIRLWRSYSEGDGEVALGNVDEVVFNNQRSGTLRSKEDGREVELPTSLTWVPRASGWLLAGFASASCALFDTDSGTLVRSFDLPISQAQSDKDASATPRVFSVSCHPSSDLAAAAQIDGFVPIFSTSSGQVALVLDGGHGDLVSAVAFSPTNTNEIVTACHDGYLRIFDIRSGGRHCFRQVHLHDRKFAEAIHCISHGGDRIATAGADSNIMVVGLAD